MFLSAPSQAPPEKPPRVSTQVIVVGLKTSDLVLKLLSKGVSRPLEVSRRAAIKAAVLLGAL